MSKRLLILAACPLLFWACSRTASVGSTPASLGEFYTQVNMWVEVKGVIPTTNYHMGELIPLGSRVTVTAANARDIKFNYNGRALTMRREHRHTLASVGEVQNRMFNSTNPLQSAAFTSLSAQHQADVRAGRVTVGMTKEAVLMAYGYPPEHETAIAGDVWKFWRNRYISQTVTFANGRVVSTAGF